MAHEALERAYALAPRRPWWRCPCPGPDDDGEEARADQLLQAVIAEDPANIEASLRPRLHGPAKEDFQTALDRWQGMLPLLEPGSGPLHHGGALHGVRQAAAWPAWHRRDHPRLFEDGQGKPRCWR